ncbi:DNA-binding NarL/FixJ family response regulator [Marmoricola sp. URHA0025 HA25]
MSRDLTARRVQRDIDVIARAGLETRDFLAEAIASLGRVVPHVGACVAHLDPSTRLNTGAHKFGDLLGRDEHDAQWGLLEFTPPNPVALRELAARNLPAVAIQEWNRTGDEPTSRLDDFMRPNFDYGDELRTVFRDGDQVWGGMSIFRGDSDRPFDAADVAFMSSLSTAFALGMRTGLLAGLMSAAAVPASGPAVLIVGADDTITQLSDGAEERLTELTTSTELPTGVVAALVAAARRYAAGTLDHPPRCRTRGRNGMWLTLHATTLSARDGAAGDVVVTIDEARPPEIVPLVVAAFDLTPRERDVTLLVLQGVETKEIATRLHLSPYTVQDHLKSVFDKACVRSRRELIARIYFDQYVPRMGTDIGPSGWFAAVES